MGPFPDPAAQPRTDPRSMPPAAWQSEDTSPLADNDEDTQPRRAIRPVSRAPEPLQQEPAYREHVSGSLFVPLSEAPNFRPAYQPYQPPQQDRQDQRPQPAQGYQHQQQQNQRQPYYPAYPGYPQRYPYSQQYAPPAAYPGYPPYNNGYYGYPPYPYPYPYSWQPARPRRDTYLFGISIASFIGSILTLLVGLADIVILLIIVALPTSEQINAGQKFNVIVQFTAFAVAALSGGGFSLYHSIRSLFLKKPSAAFKLPWFWLFLILYLAVIGAGILLHNAGQSVSNEPLTIFLIALAGIFPALTILALGVRRVHFPKGAAWPTTWRRFTLALTSGTTLAIALALLVELVLTVILARDLGVSIFTIDNPDQSIPHTPGAIIFLLLLASVIAPLVEEAVKPLAAVVMMGRIRSAAEAFVLGLACGIGFDLIETAGYISMGYRNWLDVAIQRSSAGLLHGFGAAMVALGWYYVTHPDSSRRRFLLAAGCWGYALLQHALWNGSFVLQLLPAPVGPYLDKGSVTLGSFSFPSFYLVYLVETALMLIFFLYVTKKLRTQPPPPQQNRHEAQAGFNAFAQPVASS
jgi:RsiW-degrading membrane proteinase PrsW (M82 family)